MSRIFKKPMEKLALDITLLSIYRSTIESLTNSVLEEVQPTE